MSHAQFNCTEDRLYVGHKINGDGRITTFARNTTTGALSVLGSLALDPFVPPPPGVGEMGPRASQSPRRQGDSRFRREDIAPLGPELRCTDAAKPASIDVT